MLIKDMSFARANLEVKKAHKHISEAITEQYKSYWIERLKQINIHIEQIRQQNNGPAYGYGSSPVKN